MASASMQVSFGKLISFANRREKCMLWTGWLFACISGIILPAFLQIIGDVFDSFSPGTPPEETRDIIRRQFGIMMGLCAVIMITATLQSSCLAAASSKIAARIKTRYLEAILRQESAWFDLINYTELSSRLARESQSMQRAIGEKFGQIIFSLSMGASGVTLGFTKGWSLALAIMAIGPFFMIGGAVFGNAIRKRVMTSMRAYG